MVSRVKKITAIGALVLFLSGCFGSAGVDSKMDTSSEAGLTNSLKSALKGMTEAERRALDWAGIAISGKSAQEIYAQYPNVTVREFILDVARKFEADRTEYVRKVKFSEGKDSDIYREVFKKTPEIIDEVKKISLYGATVELQKDSLGDYYQAIYTIKNSRLIDIKDIGLKAWLLLPDETRTEKRECQLTSKNSLLIKKEYSAVMMEVVDDKTCPNWFSSDLKSAKNLVLHLEIDPHTTTTENGVKVVPDLQVAAQAAVKTIPIEEKNIKTAQSIIALMQKK